MNNKLKLKISDFSSNIRYLKTQKLSSKLNKIKLLNSNFKFNLKNKNRTDILINSLKNNFRHLDRIKKQTIYFKKINKKILLKTELVTKIKDLKQKKIKLCRIFRKKLIQIKALFEIKSFNLLRRQISKKIIKKLKFIKLFLKLKKIYFKKNKFKKKKKKIKFLMSKSFNKYLNTAFKLKKKINELKSKLLINTKKLKLVLKLIKKLKTKKKKLYFFQDKFYVSKLTSTEIQEIKKNAEVKSNTDFIDYFELDSNFKKNNKSIINSIVSNINKFNTETNNFKIRNHNTHYNYNKN
jgi:hypothetical protein